MPELVHGSSPTRPSAGSLLSAAGTVRVLQPTDAADAYVNDLCAHVFLAGIEHRGLRHVQRVEIERQKGTFEDLHRHGRIERSWRTSAEEDAVVSLPGGELALLVGWRGGCEIVVAGGDHVAVRRAADRLVRALRERAPRSDELVVRFWSVDRSHGRRRRLEAPAWREIASNHPAGVRRGLASLLRARCPGRGSVLL
jgi:hypothetical protein